MPHFQPLPNGDLDTKEPRSDEAYCTQYFNIDVGHWDCDAIRSVLGDLFKISGEANPRLSLGNARTKVKVLGMDLPPSRAKKTARPEVAAASSTYPSGLKALAHARRTPLGRSSAPALRLTLKAATGALGHPALIPVLQALYPSAKLLSVGDRTYPVAVFPMPFREPASVEDVLVRPVERHRAPDTDLVAIDASMRAINEVAGRRPTDDPTFVLRALDVTGPTPKLTCELGSYFRALDTCDSLEWELLHLLATSKVTSESMLRDPLRSLPLRRALHRAVPVPIHDGSRRSAAIAVSALVAFRYEGGIRMLVRKRSSEGVSVHGGLLHVIPSFMFQPMTAFIEEEFSIRHAVRKEYLEELFSRSEIPTDTDPRAIESDPVLHRLDECGSRLIAERVNDFETTGC